MPWRGQSSRLKRDRKTADRRTHIAVLDIGTSGVKAFVFGPDFKVASRAWRPLEKYSPRRGWVEQKPPLLLAASRLALRAAVKASRVQPQKFIGLGIANQRETTILWDRKTSKPIYDAIVWEDARTRKDAAEARRKTGEKIRKKTGLVADAYFSATKIGWVIKNVPTAQSLLKQGRLCFGTVDSWIVWNFSREHNHLTDETNASRTLLFNARTRQWDGDLLRIFKIPGEILPRVAHSHSLFGRLRQDILGFPLPIRAVCGDQQASLYAALKKSPGSKAAGTTKITYGTGTFLMQVIGASFSLHPPFFTTLVPNGAKPLYALEAKIDCGGKSVERVLKKPKELKMLFHTMAKKIDRLIRRLPQKPGEIIIDGGVTRDKGLRAIQAGVSGIPVRKQKIFDGTALGVAMLVQGQDMSNQ